MLKMERHSLLSQKKINWKIIESYFKDHHLERLVRHQIESYDNFVNNQIKKTIDMFNVVNIRSEHDKDIKTGDITNHAYHFKNLSDGEAQYIYDHVK